MWSKGKVESFRFGVCLWLLYEGTPEPQRWLLLLLVQHTGDYRGTTWKTKDKSSTRSLNLHCDLCVTDMTFHTVARKAWESLKEVIRKFLGNNMDPDFENIFGNMLGNLKVLGCSISLKLHFELSSMLFPRKSRRCQWGRRREFPTGHKGNGTDVSESLECQHDSRLLLDAA